MSITAGPRRHRGHRCRLHRHRRPGASRTARRGPDRGPVRRLRNQRTDRPENRHHPGRRHRHLLRRHGGRRTDEPDGSVTATIDTGTGYSIGSPAAATVTVTDNDATTPSTGPTISIADATMNENQHNGWFTVTLSEKVAWPVHVYYATRDSTPVSAVAGQDYLAWKRSWQLRARFRPGQTETKIHVVLYNDSHDEDPETFEMVLFDAGVNGPPDVSVSIADGVAVGTITNSDPMPAAFLSRFGRTVAQQALDGIETRLTAERTPGTAATIAGQALALGTSGQATEGNPLDDLPGTARAH